MNFKFLSRFAISAGILFPLACANTSMAAEKSLWQRFTSFFDPSPSVEGEGPEYDELRAMDEKIYKMEGQYSRERRPGNKARIKKEIEDLRVKRDKLADEIEKKEKARKSGTVSAASSPAASSANVATSAANSAANSSATATSSAAEPSTTVPATNESSAATAPTATAIAECPRDTVFVHDTIAVHDTVTVHDTLYVIVANPQSAAPAENKK